MSSRVSRRKLISLLASSAALYTVGAVWAQEPRDQLKEPVFRVTKRIDPEERMPVHPLDPAITLAEQGLARIQAQVTDYTCTIVKQERINGELNPGEQIRQEEMALKLAVSRVPLREALNVLADQGLLYHRPHQGYFVTKRDPGQYAQIRRMLHLLENELMATIAWPGPNDLDRLRDLNAQMQCCVDALADTHLILVPPLSWISRLEESWHLPRIQPMTPTLGKLA